MEYEIVMLEEKKVIGLERRTSNQDPRMQEVIGGLWQQLYGQGCYGQIQDKSNDRSIGLYSDYENQAEGAYSVTVGCEVKAVPALITEPFVLKIIPAGRYARFEIYGDEVEAVGQLWNEIWQLPLERTFTGDFEEYYPVEEGKEPKICVYVAVR